ncbi:MAG TPA: hypothetical protein VJZ72_02685, partial [Candidatus Limnocylindrales bacterium]|nr:hypothetical protein [Candidatus Limnocylindrales bacterium]
IELLERSTAIVPLPDTVAALGDLYRLTGRERDAATQYATVRAIGTVAAASGPVYDRALTMFELDHGGDPSVALARAEAELEKRGDVFGHDVVAWGLYANGRMDEADRAIGLALSLDTRDALIRYHAGMIAAAVGDDGRAWDLLGESLDLGLGIDPVAAERARTILATLD